MTDPSGIVAAGASTGLLVNSTMMTMLTLADKMQGEVVALTSKSIHSLPAGVTVPDQPMVVAKGAFVHGAGIALKITEDVAVLKTGKKYTIVYGDAVKKLKKKQLQPNEKLVFPSKTTGLKDYRCSLVVEVTRAVGDDGRAHVVNLAVSPGPVNEFGPTFQKTTPIVGGVAVWKEDGSCTGINLTYSVAHKGFLFDPTMVTNSAITVWGDGTCTLGSGPMFEGYEDRLTSEPLKASALVREKVKQRRVADAKAQQERKADQAQLLGSFWHPGPAPAGPGPVGWFATVWNNKIPPAFSAGGDYSLSATGAYTSNAVNVPAAVNVNAQANYQEVIAPVKTVAAMPLVATDCEAVAKEMSKGRLNQSAKEIIKWLAMSQRRQHRIDFYVAVHLDEYANVVNNETIADATWVTKNNGENKPKYLVAKQYRDDVDYIVREVDLGSTDDVIQNRIWDKIANLKQKLI